LCINNPSLPTILDVSPPPTPPPVEEEADCGLDASLEETPPDVEAEEETEERKEVEKEVEGREGREPEGSLMREKRKSMSQRGSRTRRLETPSLSSLK